MTHGSRWTYYVRGRILGWTGLQQNVFSVFVGGFKVIGVVGSSWRNTNLNTVYVADD